MGDLKLDRTLLSDQVYEGVREQILAQEYPPGTRIVESEIARRLGISQAPVREALRRLAHEGLVLQFPRRGTFVAEISADEARHSYLVRAALEEVAVVEVLPQIDASFLELLEGSFRDMVAAASRDDVDGLVNADVAFHETVWQASGNPVLMRIWPMVETSMRRFTRVANTVYFGDLDEVARTHEPLLAGLRARDPAVSALFRDHVNEVWQRLSQAGRGGRRSSSAEGHSRSASS